jgi:hypothetical protein
MQSVLRNLPWQAMFAASRQQVTTVRIAVVFEDFTSGVAAQNFSDKFSSELPPEFRVRRDLWSFEVLNHPQIRSCAVSDALAAEVIILAARKNVSRLPAQVRDWMQAWLPLKHARPSTLVSLLEADACVAAQNESLRSSLRQAAEDAGMDFQDLSWRCPFWSAVPVIDNGVEVLGPQDLGMGN